MLNSALSASSVSATGETESTLFLPFQLESQDFLQVHDPYGGEVRIPWAHVVRLLLRLQADSVNVFMAEYDREPYGSSRTGLDLPSSDLASVP